MAARASLKSGLRFGVFELDATTGELRKNGVRLKLQPQPVKVLILLASRAGDLITREDLKKTLWGEDTFVDFEQGLNSCIRQIRNALADDPDSPRYIQTIPRQGYRFIAHVVSADASVAGVAPPAIVQSPPLRMWLWLTGGILIVAADLAWVNFPRVRTPLPAPAPAARVMLAVLPFENYSADRGRDYLADGLTEEMIAQLGSLEPHHLGVIARTSAMKYKGARTGIDQIGRELAVDYVVEGSIRPQGDRIRITAQLIRVKDQTHLWARSYQRQIKDVLQLESDAANEIVQQIGYMTSERANRQPRGRVISVEAHENYLKGRYRWNQRTEDGLRAALDHFQKAIELQPDYGEAYAGVADSYIMLANWGFMPGSEAYPRAKAAARKALELDDQLPEAHTSLAYATFLFDRDWPGTEQQFRRAIDLAPNYATAHHFYSIYLMASGRHAEAQVEILRAKELDPLSLIINSVVGWIYYEGRRYDRAVQQCQRTAQMDPNYAPALLDLGTVYLKTGDYTQALVQFERARSIAGDTAVVLGYIAQAQALAGEKKQAREILLRLEGARDPHFVSDWDLALIYDALGEKKEALAHLERAVDQRAGWAVLIGVEPALDNLRNEPRFKILEQRIHVPIVM